MEHETLTCPFCGAPYREVIPSGTVQMQCKYCGGTILVPPYFGGEVRRCPNHPDVLAIGLCNDCGGSYCDSCLCFYEVEHGTLHLCSSCFKARQTERMIGVLLLGVFLLVIGIFGIVLAPSGAELVGVFFLVLALPILAWVVYNNFHLPKGLSLKERTEAIKAEAEARKVFGAQASAYELYNRMLSESMRTYGPKLGMTLLERRIGAYEQAGMTRSEAIRKVAEEKGY